MKIRIETVKGIRQLEERLLELHNHRSIDVIGWRLGHRDNHYLIEYHEG